MPRTLDPSKYPPEFVLLLDRVQLAPVIIPRPEGDRRTITPGGPDPLAPPAGLRAYIQAFLRACESSGADSPLGVKARQVQVTAHKAEPLSPDPRKHRGYIIVQRRSDSVAGRAVAAALGVSAAQHESAGQSALAGLLKG